MSLLAESFFAFVKSKPFSVTQGILLTAVGITSLITIICYGVLWTLMVSVFTGMLGAGLLLLIMDDTKGGIVEELQQLLAMTDIPFLSGMTILHATAVTTEESSSPKLGPSAELYGSDNLTSRSLEKIYPWMNLYIPKCVDNSLTTLFGIILNEYLTTDWYHAVQVRRTFSTEIRVSGRYMASRLARKLSRINMTNFLLERFSTILTEHITVYLHLRALAAQQDEKDITKLLADHPELSHSALSSDTEADSFYHELATRILTSIVPREFRKFPASVAVLREVLADTVLKITVDCMSEPHQVNHLLVLAIEAGRRVAEPVTEEVDSTPVPFLKNLTIDEKCPSTVQRVPFRQILKEPTLKNTFEQHLKSLGLDDFFRIHESMEWINKIMESGVIGESLMNSVFVTLTRLQREVTTAETKGYIFPALFVGDLRNIVNTGISGVGKLRQMASWKDMLTKLVALLENVLVPGFQETRLYHHLLIPPTEEVVRKPIRRILSQKRPPRKTDSTSLQQFGETVRGALKDVPPVVNSHDLDDDDSNLPDDEFDDIDEERGTTEDALGSTLRDLSYYDIVVNRAEKRRDDQGRLFMVLNVIITDRGPLSPDLGKEWSVQRKYNEFFILDAKIREFHGPMEASGHLPPKRAWFSPSLEYLQQRVKMFETFLTSLTKEPKLRYSQMLYNFLATTLEFDAVGGFPDLGLGKVMRTVPQMLTSERGQNVESFVRALLTAALPPRTKVASENLPDLINSERTLRAEDFVDGVLEEKCVFHDSPLSPLDEYVTGLANDDEKPSTNPNLSSVFDKVLYLSNTLLRTDSELVGLAACFRTLGRPLCEKLAHSATKDLVGFFQSPSQISFLIDLLSETLTSTAPEVDLPEIQRRRDVTKRLFDSFAENEWIQLICGDEALHVTHVIFDVFQYKVLNRRLALVLLEAVVDEIFPKEYPSDASLTGS